MLLFDTFFSGSLLGLVLNDGLMLALKLWVRQHLRDLDSLFPYGISVQLVHLYFLTQLFEDAMLGRTRHASWNDLQKIIFLASLFSLDLQAL